MRVLSADQNWEIFWMNNNSYYERLSRLNLLPLTYWREVKDLIFYFKCRAGHYTLPTDDYVKPKEYVTWIYSYSWVS